MRLRAALGLSLAAVLAGCGSGPATSTPAPTAGWERHSEPDRGFSVSFPALWTKPGEPISRITDPRELFLLATFPAHWQETDCEAFAGAGATAMTRTDVFVVVWERGRDPHGSWDDFPSRPERFGPVARPERAVTGCGEPPGTVQHWRNFTDAGRHFHSNVVVGAEASERDREDVWRILDSLAVDPGVPPTWSSADP